MRQLLTAICVCVIGQSLLGEDLNGLILEQVKNMPSGGRYSVSHFATIKLQSAAHFESGKFFIIPTAPFPSFCSGATYIVFIKTIEALRASGALQVDFATLDQLVIRDQHDGEGIWGRWNANGPGTARLFYELGLGRNFTDFNHARPGDFMKIFWNKNVGRRETPRVSCQIGERDCTPTRTQFMTEQTLTINEICKAMQAESTWAGQRCVVVQLTLFDVRYNYCYTKYAFYEGKKQMLNEIDDL